MSDLIERLRHTNLYESSGDESALGEEAADEIERLQAALRAQQPQPIATAPRDGTPILVLGGTFTDHDDATFTYKGECEEAAIAQWHKDCWYGATLEGHDNFREHFPTHWLPLPTPPQET